MRYTGFLATLPFPHSYHYSLLPTPCSLLPKPQNLVPHPIDKC
ncbi:hypothetical protein [Moorena sp. SIO3I8]|nr:hypothetical protein [Moorena sp. SIO3I8]